MDRVGPDQVMTKSGIRQRSLEGAILCDDRSITPLQTAASSYILHVHEYVRRPKMKETHEWFLGRERSACRALELIFFLLY
jgi:hypothetical protein